VDDNQDWDSNPGFSGGSGNRRSFDPSGLSTAATVHEDEVYRDLFVLVVRETPSSSFCASPCSAHQ
jgi:hypothetical protein